MADDGRDDLHERRQDRPLTLGVVYIDDRRGFRGYRLLAVNHEQAAAIANRVERDDDDDAVRTFLRSWRVRGGAALFGVITVATFALLVYQTVHGSR